MAARGDEITLEGQPESVQRAEHILQELADWTRTYHQLKPEDISRAIRATEEKRDIPLKPYTFSTNTLSTTKGTVNPKTPTQQDYLQAIKQSDLVIAIWTGRNRENVFGHGDGLGRTDSQNMYSRIILARPAVEAGEHLGFLPGDLFAKVPSLLAAIIRCPLHDDGY